MSPSADLITELIDHIKRTSLRTDGPFTLRSGAVSDWYVDARQTTFTGTGAVLVGRCVLSVLRPAVTAVGGMTMGADPIAIATALIATEAGRPLRAFSVRKAAKDHGTGGRLVGALEAGDRAAVVEDTTTTGSALLEVVEVLHAEDVAVVQAIALVDRSAGSAASKLEDAGVPFDALILPADLGVTP